eukprot:2226002-Amphidinium_carterae.1
MSCKVDAIEHLPLETARAGDGFTVMAAKLDGRLLGVGRGAQLATDYATYPGNSSACIRCLPWVVLEQMEEGISCG